MKRLAVLILVASAAALAWQVRAHLDAPEPAPVIGSAEAPSVLEGIERDAPDAVPALPPLAALRDTVERPLFRADRRPPTQAAETDAPAAASRPAAPPSAVLIGVVILAGEPVALLQESRSGTPTRARLGDSLDGWEVSAIRADTMVLRQAGVEHVLPLRRFEAAPVVPLPGAAKRPGGLTADSDERAAPDPDSEDPAAVRRLRRPRQGPRAAARERLERRRAAGQAQNR